MADSTAMTFKLFGHDVSASKTFKDVGKTAAGVASGMGVAFAAGKVADWAKQSMTAFEDVGKSSLGLQRMIGGSIEDASRLGHAFRMSGLDSDAAGKSIKILSTHLANNDKAAKSLGISFRDAAGNIKPMGELLPQIAEKFKTMPDGAEKTALAVQLFGKNGVAMLPFLNKGAAGIQELMKQSDALGTTMSGKDGQALKDYTKAHRQWDEAVKGVQISLGRALYPTLTKLVTTILPMIMPHLQDFTKEMAKAPDIIAQKWPAIQDAIKKVFDNLGKVQKVVKDNWPAIKDTFSKVADAVERAGQWTRYLWEKFQSLPGPVKELIALLAIASRTGVLTLALKGFDLAKNLIAKIAGMSIQAATVIVNGASVGGAGAGTAASGAGAGAAAKGAGGMAATLGKLGGWAAAAYVLYWGLNNAWQVIQRKISPEEGMLKALKGLVPGGTVITDATKLWQTLWDMLTGKAQKHATAMQGLNWWDGVLTRGQQRLADQVGNTNLTLAQRMLVLSRLRDAGVIEIQSLRDQGASTEAIELKTAKWKDAIQKAGEKLGWTQEQIDAYKGKLDSIPYGKETVIRARTVEASKSVLGLASTINGVVHPPPILFSADPSGAVAAINTILRGLSMVRSAGDMARIRWGFGVPGSSTAFMARGGIVTRATMAVIGEAGPEAVIPLSRAQGLGGNTEVHVHVSGSVFATKEQMAREVVAALQNAKNRGLQLNLAG